MKREGYILALILWVLIVCAENADTKYKICVTERHTSLADCQKLQENASKVICIRVSGATDCALKLERGEADFGIFTAEEAILMSKFDTQEQRVVFAEIRPTHLITEENFQFETVAIVEEEKFRGTLKDLKGMQFCHPGFNKPQRRTDRVLKHFERVVLKDNSPECIKSMGTAVEDELSALSSFFGNSCRPGEWAGEQYWNKNLKRKYPKLCELCDSKRDCSQNLHTNGNQNAALDCLTKGGGNVAYVENYYVKKYFHQVNGGYSDPPGYKYLCPNGSVQNIGSNERPCTWLQQPCDSIIAKDKETADKVSVILGTSVANVGKTRTSNPSMWKDVLARILYGNDNTLFKPPNKTSLKTFIQSGREIPETASTVLCHKPIKWCTTSELENNKCEWLCQAALIQGIVPELQCVQGTSHLDCFKKINMTEADIVGTNSDLGPIATHFFNLKTVAYQETVESGSFKVVAVVNYNLAATKMRELKDKKACFPEFAGLAWIAFVEAIRNSSESESKVCPYDDSAGTFFASICAPGSKDLLRGSEDIDLCALCHEAYANSDNSSYGANKSCDATAENKFYGDAGALRCLASGVADVAFINTYNLPMILQDMPGDFKNNYTIMCRNGSKVPLTTNPDDECALTVVTGGEVVARGNLSKDELRDFSLTLLKLDELFGIDGHFANMFNLYEPFNNTKDLLFRGEAFGFVTLSHVNEVARVDTYAFLKHKAEECKHPKKDSGAKGSEVVQKTALLLIVILNYLLF
uniref:Transferrin n=1 Tax=Reticulitermes speratus TaxID=60591 RepID=A0A1V1FVP3_9NEOP